MTDKIRCSWVNLDNPLYIDYHDKEWGVPCFDDYKLFEMLILEGAQAGLSWETILNKRENYRKAFDGFNPKIISKYDESKVKELLNDSGIVRNKLKINAAIKNAKAFLKIQKEHDSFSDYIWGFVQHQPIQNHIENYKNAPTNSKISFEISKELKKKGMSFVGPTIIYAFMQAIGMVNDHEIDCFCKNFGH